MIEGIDFSRGNGLTTQQVKAAGYQFICRYLTGMDGNPKDITAAELGNCLAADLPVVLVFERDGLMPSEAQGAADARAAQAQLGMLAHETGHDAVTEAAVFFAADSGAPGDVAGYMRGVCSVIGKARAGIYGGIASVRAAFDAGVTAYGWQTAAWSSGQWDNRALLRQVKNGIRVGPAECDLDQAAYWATPTPVLTARDDFGQFPRPGAPTPPEPIEGIVVVLPGGVARKVLSHDGGENWA